MQKEKIIQRDIMPEIENWLGEEKILIIKGSRQTGKTTLIKQLQAKLESAGGQTLYYSVDSERFNPIFDNAHNFINFLNDQYLSNNNGGGKKQKLFVFLDEFQYLNDPGLFLKSVFDAKKNSVQLIVSGSSSLEIAKTDEFLTGRKVSFYLHRFSFREFLRVKSDIKYEKMFNIGSQDDWESLEQFYTLYRDDLERHLLDYVNWGGYPEVSTHSEEKKREVILKEIVKTYIEKDVSDFLRIENLAGFNNLIKVLSAQVGNLIKRSELANMLDIDERTVEKYITILEGTFIFNRLKPFYSNVRKTLRKSKKIYIEDLGVIKVALNRGILDDFTLLPGELLENFVYNELSLKFGRGAISFYRTKSGAEIDFIVNTQGVKFACEVKFRKNVMRVPRVLKEFTSENKWFNTPLVFTQDTILKTDAGGIFLPVVLLPFVELS